ncbi:uncharacterized protein LOC102803033 isoform X2 [Saccoglossus kowalevskii]|nr:PREDICTED: uncharacterized protein LOC102803033 isoform X2 [Saccoglossus kowalevskii]
MHFTYLVCLLVLLVCLATSVAASNIDECDYYCGGTCRAKKCNRGEIASENSYYYWYYGCSHYCGEGRVCCVQDYDSDVCEYYCGGTCRSKKCNRDEITTESAYSYWSNGCSSYCGEGRVCCIPEPYDVCDHECGGTCRAKKCNADEEVSDYSYCNSYCEEKKRLCCVQ